MKTVINQEMSEAIIEADGMAILHRFMPFEEQVNLYNRLRDRSPIAEHHVALSVGVQEADFVNLKHLLESDDSIRMVCIDVAHGDSDMCVNMTKRISEIPYVHKLAIIAGNVATGDGAMSLWRAGASAVKVGIGPGSLCSTRVETGNGVPQLTALIDVAAARDSYRWNREGQFPHMHIIADGGIKSAGDCVKALCFADMVMVGNLFAGTDEAPGEITYVNGNACKNYEGSSTYKTKHIEGVKAVVKAKGPVSKVINSLIDGIQSGCSYQSAKSIRDLRSMTPEFVRITNAGLRESHPHDVTIK